MGICQAPALSIPRSPVREIVRAPIGADDGGYAASYADPDGNLWQLTYTG
jgi:hypothetical protein